MDLGNTEERPDDREDLAGTTVLVTGGTGSLGSALSRAICHRGATAVIVTGADSESLPRPGNGVEVLRRDVRAQTFWSEFVPRVDRVYHLAGQTSAHAANRDPIGDVEANLLPVARLVAACEQHRRRPDIVFAGTATQVGFTESIPTDERLPDAPATVYDINKLAGEHYLGYYARELGGRAVTLRLTNVYGPGPSSRHAERGIVSLMIRRALQRDPLTVYGDGTYVRDFLYVDDAVDAFLAAGAHLDRLERPGYLVGSGAGCTILEMADEVRRAVAEVTGHLVDIQHVTAPEDIPRIDRRSFVADSSAFRAQTGWSPRIALRSGIRYTIRHTVSES